MLIGDRYKIESDSLNITLYRKGTSKVNGNNYWRPISYFSTVGNALEGLVDLEVAETGLKDLRTVVEKQKELYLSCKQKKSITVHLQKSFLL